MGQGEWREKEGRHTVSATETVSLRSWRRRTTSLSVARISVGGNEDVVVVVDDMLRPDCRAVREKGLRLRRIM